MAMLQNYILPDIIQFILNEYIDHNHDVYLLSNAIRFEFKLGKYQSKLYRDGDGDTWQVIDGQQIFHMSRSQYINLLAGSPLKYNSDYYKNNKD
jgi:hypothetical protein